MPAPVGSAVPVINDCSPTGSFNTSQSAFRRPRWSAGVKDQNCELRS